MNSGARISVAATNGLLDAMAAAGINPDEVLRQFGLGRSIFADPDRYIATSIFARILEQAARRTGDECFGLHFGERYNPRDIGTLAYVVLNSPTVAAAIQNVERYIHIHNAGVKVAFSVEGGQGHLRFLLSAPPPDSMRQHAEYSMAVIRNAFRIIAGDQWTPQEVQFTHQAPARVSEHVRVFGSPVLFGCAANALVVEGDFVERQVPAADHRLYRILKQHAERVLSEMPPQDDLLASVRKAVAESISEGDPKLARVAKTLPMSPRTLERRLRDRGVVFRKLVDDMRRRFALDYLKDRRRTLTEIAFLLGYSEVSAFNRAFKRWTGSTPLEYRIKQAH